MSVPAISRCSAARNDGRCRTRAPWAAARRPSARTSVAGSDGMATTTTSHRCSWQHLAPGRRACRGTGRSPRTSALLGRVVVEEPDGVSPNELTRCRSRASAGRPRRPRRQRAQTGGSRRCSAARSSALSVHLSGVPPGASDVGDRSAQPRVDLVVGRGAGRGAARAAGRRPVGARAGRSGGASRPRPKYVEVVHRDEVHRGADAALGEPAMTSSREPLRVHDPDRVQVPGVAPSPVGTVRQRAARATSASRASYRAAICARRVLPVREVAQLGPADRGLQVGHVGLEARPRRRRSASSRRAGSGARRRLDMPCSRARRIQLGAVRVVGGDHAALADRQVLRGVEAEADGRAGPDPTGSRVLGAEGVRGVLDDPVERAARPPRRARPRRAGRRPSARRPSPRRPPQPPAARAHGVLGVGIPVTGSTSTRTGRSPACTIACTAPQNVIVEVSTGAPRGRPQRPERELDAGGAGGDRDGVRALRRTSRTRSRTPPPPARWSPSRSSSTRCAARLRLGGDPAVGERDRCSVARAPTVRPQFPLLPCSPVDD